jgi:L-ascorbate metabolism protein UlaG (beta-lactamase superfamily)
LVAGLAVAVHVGVFSLPRPWPEATGWAAIPAALRPPAGPPWEGDAPQISWLGHSGFLVRWKGQRLLLDPNTSRWCTVAHRLLEPARPAAELGPVDAVLISHAHYDHLDLPTLRQVRPLGAVVLPAGSEDYLEGPAWRGVAKVGLVPGERFQLGELEIVAVAAAHNGNRFHPLASRQQALGYVVRAGDDAFYFAGDTGPSNDFAAIGTAYRPRLAILPIGAYAPRWPIGLYHLNPEQAVAAARQLGVETVIPCHFGTFALALDQPATALPRFARAAAAQGVAWRMPQLLRPAAAGAGGRG